MQLEFQLFYPHGSITAAIGLKRTPSNQGLSHHRRTYSFFGCWGRLQHNLYCYKNTATLSLSWKMSNSFSCSSLWGNEGYTVKASYVHYIDQLKRGDAGGEKEITREFSTKEHICSGNIIFTWLPHPPEIEVNNPRNQATVLQHVLNRRACVTISSCLECCTQGSKKR